MSLFPALLCPESTPAEPVDPWTALLRPALAGRLDVTRARFAARGASTLQGPLGDRHAVFARALAAAGQAEEAHHHLNEALARGSDEATRLASVVRTDGEAHARERTSSSDPGEAADAWCDLAWRALVDRQLAAARSCAAAALSALPDHAEAARWDRFLGHAGGRACDLMAHSAALGCGRSVAADDARALAPVASLGWLSEERWMRRVLTERWSRPGPPGSALLRLQREGRHSRLLGTARDYASTHRGSPLRAAEAAYDVAISLDREGRAAGLAATQAWSLAAKVDPMAQRDLAGGLVALGVRNLDAAPMGLVAADLLQAFEPEQPLWRAYEARLLSVLGEHEASVERASRLLRERDLDSVSFALCIDTLRTAGADRLARTRLRASKKRPTLRSVACMMLQQWDDPQPLRPMVSDRVTDRRLDLARAPSGEPRAPWTPPRPAEPAPAG